MLSLTALLAMPTLTIRNVAESLKAALRVRAARHDRSMEEEVRHLLRQAVIADRAESGLGSRIARRFAAEGGVELPAVKRSRPRRPPRLSA
jgi:plasmid stability protein